MDDRGLLELGLDRQLTRFEAQRARRLRSIDDRQAYLQDAWRQHRLVVAVAHPA